MCVHEFYGAAQYTRAHTDMRASYLTIVSFYIYILIYVHAHARVCVYVCKGPGCGPGREPLEIPMTLARHNTSWRKVCAPKLITNVTV